MLNQAFAIWTFFSTLLTQVLSGLQKQNGLNQVVHVWISYKETTFNISHNLCEVYYQLLLISWKNNNMLYTQNPVANFLWKDMVQVK